MFFYLTTHSTHFIYCYMASHIWLRTILIVRKETRCRHIGYSHRLTTRVLLYAPSHRQDNTYHGLCYTSRGALAGTRIIIVFYCIIICVCVCSIYCNNYFTFVNVHIMCSRASRPNAKIKVSFFPSFTCSFIIIAN